MQSANCRLCKVNKLHINQIKKTNRKKKNLSVKIKEEKHIRADKGSLCV